ncbi:MAG: hypothetical protein LBC18_11040 [Opitutaceae bacterium]|jgi:predicted GH43/DUF377 family glycosyl hydrolase|nr:hypothetical protein [Opitutaceae bacterium]
MPGHHARLAAAALPAVILSIAGFLGAAPDAAPPGAPPPGGAPGASPADVIPLPPGPGRAVPGEVMRRIHDEVKTPFKYGVVLKGGSAAELVDCPSVFRHRGRWYMMYAAIRDEVGYETFLARSDDLLHWEKLGKILSFRREGWDAWQADGGISLPDWRWEGGTHEPGTHDGKYWLSYIGGARQGYEPDPLAIGLASTDDPARPAEWTRLPANPVLSTAQPGARPFERNTLYKSTVIRVASGVPGLGAGDGGGPGWPFVMFYNGKSAVHAHEAIGMAVSRDMVRWTRLGADFVVDNAPGKPAISGDPQIVKIGDVWVMFYFGFRWRPHAFDTFACSYDLVHWTRWDGPNLVEPGEPFDRTFAHKPWVLKHDGVVYHFYCAVGDEGRVIALATSKDLRAADETRNVAKP